MDVRGLRYFVQVVESGSLTKASRQFFVAQPALSQQIARLEDEVGKPLLVRSARGVVPTPNGAALYRHAKLMLRQLDEAVLIARQESSNVKGRVTLGLAPTTTCMVGLPLLLHMKENYPGIVLNVVSALPQHLEERARRDELDVAILFSKTAASDLVFEPLLEEDVFVIVPADSQLIAPDKTSLTLAEAAALPMVLSSPSHNLRRRFTSELERANLSVEILAEIDSVQLVMLYVAKGGGATVQPMAATQVHYAQQGWRCLPIADAPISRVNYVYSLPAHKLSASASIVHTELAHVAHRLIQSGIWQGARILPAPQA
ncbi:transcriptional regulator LysR family (plasmid) [Cupriavidus necator N-1]|uniref:Transcriptional regulator LysR family n=1 Tax=Cupriavidus necator (strain ATCC 43291 / DSM 13513 / CCUG 52238 / LMG 8453 / N-1) TaxID=1042878 RepID=F8GXF4_CUPNN|nr:LysR substrate-binding domain-containing protein [Cupriavidus necator]AEI82024.1 transcriptional regulator LysR family [Cupriavidus necator N-1]MDX6008342.1 LysR substrate-binding domain-containing protein [Cupriavidus necator]